jgi:hypothetical protein
VADEKHFQRDAKPSRDFVADGHAAARHRQDQHVVSSGVLIERARQQLPRFRTVSEARLVTSISVHERVQHTSTEPEPCRNLVALEALNHGRVIAFSEARSNPTYGPDTGGMDS